MSTKPKPITVYRDGFKNDGTPTRCKVVIWKYKHGRLYTNVWADLPHNGTWPEPAASEWRELARMAEHLYIRHRRTWSTITQARDSVHVTVPNALVDRVVSAMLAWDDPSEVIRLRQLYEVSPAYDDLVAS